MKDEELRQNAGQIAALEAKINTIPNVKVALEGINNQYQSAKTDLRRPFEKEERREFASRRRKQRAGRNDSRA